jgi:hypothetical protein
MIGVVVCRDFFSQSTGASLLVFLFLCRVELDWCRGLQVFSQSTGASLLFSLFLSGGVSVGSLPP